MRYFNPVFRQFNSPIFYKCIIKQNVAKSVFWKGIWYEGIKDPYSNLLLEPYYANPKAKNADTAENN